MKYIKFAGRLLLGLFLGGWLGIAKHREVTPQDAHDDVNPTPRNRGDSMHS